MSKADDFHRLHALLRDAVERHVGDPSLADKVEDDVRHLIECAITESTLPDRSAEREWVRTLVRRCAHRRDAARRTEPLGERGQRLEAPSNSALTHAWHQQLLEHSDEIRTMLSSKPNYVEVFDGILNGQRYCEIARDLCLHPSRPAQIADSIGRRLRKKFEE